MKADQFDAAELVDPVGLIEFAEFDGVGDEDGGDEQAAGGGTGVQNTQPIEDRHSPQQRITSIVDALEGGEESAALGGWAGRARR
ncbi:MAG: hypothetical protein R3E39_18650 [Anaerolineae bacterium]